MLNCSRMLPCGTRGHMFPDLVCVFHACVCVFNAEHIFAFIKYDFSRFSMLMAKVLKEDS